MSSDGSPNFFGGSKRTGLSPGVQDQPGQHSEIINHIKKESEVVIFSFKLINDQCKLHLV